MKKPKIKKDKKIYKGKEVSLRVIEWELKGKKMKKEVVIFPDTVGILPLVSKDKIILVRQYRFPSKKELWEIPAGKIEKNEKPKSAAKRELKEETGFEARKIEKIAEFYPTPGYSTEYIHLFRATSLKKGKQHLDEDEIIRTKAFTLEEALKMIKSRRIIDAKTACTIILEAKRREK
jgi:ADP-ribose pyrophosphatase